MQLIFIRHGESEANVLQTNREDFYCGRWDCELTENGRLQARRLRGAACLKVKETTSDPYSLTVFSSSSRTVSSGSWK